MEFMNLPVEADWTAEEIRTDYQNGYTKKQLSRIYLIPPRELTKIITKEEPSRG